MIDIQSYQEYLRDNGYGKGTEEHKRRIGRAAQCHHS